MINEANYDRECEARWSGWDQGEDERGKHSDTDAKRPAFDADDGDGEDEWGVGDFWLVSEANDDKEGTT